MNEKKDKDLHNLSGVLNDVEEINSKLRKSLYRLCFDYQNKISGTLNDDGISRIYDSLSHRSQSLFFNLELMFLEQEWAQISLNDYKRNKNEPLRETYIMNNSSLRQFSHFDNLIFNAISLFDYSACAIEYICGGKKRIKKNWNSIVKAAQHSENELSKFKIANLVIEINKEWLDKLYEFRSNVIHYKTVSGGAVLTNNFTIGGHKLKLYAPFEFVKEFKNLKKIDEGYNITLYYASAWLVKKAIIDTTKIINNLIDHMETHREIPEDEQPIQIVKGK